MPNTKKDIVFQLIKTLTKAEKRNFRLYAKRTQSTGDQKFVKLFDVMDKIDHYDDTLILSKVKTIKKEQLANQKANLYKVLLASIRSMNKHKDDIFIRENIDYAKVLYNKGLYLQSLKILDKAKQLAKKNYETLLLLEVIEFEKEIESRYITRSIKNRATNLKTESRSLLCELNNSVELSNFSLAMYDWYLKKGFVKDERDFNKTKAYFDRYIPQVDIENLNFISKLHYFQSHVWYYLMSQDFVMCYRYASKWVDLFEEQEHMINLEPDMYLKGLHNLLNALHHIGIDHYPKYRIALKKMRKFYQTHYDNLNDNSKLMAFLYYESNRINDYFMRGKFSYGCNEIVYWEEKIEEFSDRLDAHQILLFYYRFASLLFGAGRHKEAIKYLNRILSIEDHVVRADLQVYTRLLMLISHYELGNEDLLEYQVKSTYRFLAKQKDLGEVHSEIFRFLRKTPLMTPKNVKKEFEAILEKLKVLREHPYDKRPFLYLDIISWLQSKIEGVRVEQVIREKYLGLRELP